MQYEISIHLLCEKSDNFKSIRSPSDIGFNSRPCERGDALLETVIIAICCFNSRPCERGDSNSAQISKPYLMPDYYNIH